MSTVEKISIALTPDLALMVRKAVEEGYYASTSEVVREALRDWKQKQSLHEQQNQALRQLWQAGITSGSAGGLDMEAIKREARQRYEAAHENPSA